MNQPVIDHLAAQVVYRAAQALGAAHFFEAVVHDAGPYTMTYGSLTVPAQRMVTEDAVLFTAVFPEVCWLDTPEPWVHLDSGSGDIAATMRVEHPGDCSFAVTWDVGVSVGVLAGV